MAPKKNVNPSPRFTTFLSKIFQRKPETFLSAQALETFKFDDIDFQTKKGKKLLYTIYRRHPTVFQLTRLRASIGVPSVDIITDDPRAQRVVAKFLNNLHPTSGLIFLRSFLRDLWRATEIFGTSFTEPLWNREHMNYVGLKNIHPISMDLLRHHGENSKVKLDKFGNPVGWLEEIGNTNQKKEHDFDKIKYLVFNQISDEIFGLSSIEPIYKTVWRLMNIEEGIASAIFRHGFPLYDITISGAQEGRPPTKAQLDDAADQVKGLNFKSEFIHPPNYKVKLMEAFSLGKGEDYTNTFLDMITSASGLPKFYLLGSAKELSRASAQEIQKIIGPGIEPSQEKLKLFFEKEILAPLMKANHIKEVPELVFGKSSIEVEVADDSKDKDKDDDDDTGDTGAAPVPAGIQVPKKKKKQRELQHFSITYEAESEIIKENKKKPAAKKKHKFKPAVWTHKNGHPRCLVCGDEETIDGPCDGRSDLEELAEKKLPGLYLVSPHGNLIYEGDKKQIIKSKTGMKMLRSYVGKEMYLLSDNKVWGIIKLREPREIDVNEFLHLRYAHQVSDEERKEWWPDEKKLFAYEFEIIEMFKDLKDFDVPRGVQVLVKEVEIK